MVLTVCASLVSLFDGLFYPALGGIVPATVPAELIGSANATLGFVRSVSAIAGPALGGAVYASAGMATVLALTAFAFLVALGTALAAPASARGAAGPLRPLRDIGEGARYVLSVPLLVSIPVAAVALLLSEGPTQTLLPRLVEEHFGGGAGTLSLLTTAYGAGAAAGALLYARLMPRRRRAVIVYTLWTTAHILCAAMALTTWLPGAVALAAVRGMCGGLGFALWETLLMHVVAPDKLSRVYSVNLFGTKALTPVGFALGGWLGAYLPAATVIACGQLAGAALMASLLLVRRIRAVPMSPLLRKDTTMKTVILGTGEVCRLLAPAFLSLGHEVVVGTRDPEATLAGNHPYRLLAARHPELRLVSFADAVAAADRSGLVVNAISGPACLEALAPLADGLAGHVVMDVSSPYDWSRPDVVLDPVNTDSLGEAIQRALLGAFVVKTFNTLAAQVMPRPDAVGPDHTVFLSGDDEAAKARVAELLRALGWRDVLDLGGIVTARATEMMLRMWIDTSRALGTHLFGFKIVR
ncbi:Enterobactin exporter EntS [Streptomyces californicus]